ncbi:MAG: HmuY family protein [Saprospiraceae bacterium]|nr:HmuY family protein [Saprospiraceae bacterium]
MSISFKFRFILFAVILSAVTSACKKDPELPDNLIAFETNQQGFTSAENEITIQIKFSYPATQAGSLLINTLFEGVVYNTDLTTDPAVNANAIAFPIAAGDAGKSFKVTKKAGALFDGDENIKFTIPAAPAGMVLGPNPELKLSFAEIVSAMGSSTVDGGGATYANRAFIDLSANRQTAVPRLNWDLGFASGTEFRVVLNSSNGMLAFKTGKNDINAVNASDTVDLSSRFSHNAIFAAINLTEIPGWVASSIAWIDDPSGDLSKTAIAEISATDSDNKVYIVNPGAGPGTPAPALGWKKIRVLRKGNGYTLQHADIAATSFTEVSITKDDKYNFQFADFTTGVVLVEPPKDRWDISWTGFSFSTNFGNGPVPYYFQDIILQNLYKIQTAQILTSAVSYDAFAEANLATVDFGIQSQVKIGSNWRSGGGPTSGPAIRTDRFYIIKDAGNNYYKLRFTALTSDGERGKPKMEYTLIKKG